MRRYLLLAMAMTASLSLLDPIQAQESDKTKSDSPALLKPPPDEPPGQEGAPNAFVHSLDESIKLFDARTSANPNDAQSWRYLGELYEQKAGESGDLEFYARAEDALRTSLKLQPANDRAKTSLAAVLCSRHKFAEGLTLISDVAKRQPKNPDVLAILGDASLESGRYGEAEAIYLDLVRLAEIPPVLSRLANLRDQQGKSDEALALMKKAVEQVRSKGDEKEVAWYVGRLAEITLLSGRIDEAESLYRSIPKGVDPFHDATFALGRIQEGRGRLDEAGVQYRKAIEIGADPHMLIALADLETRAGRASQAKALEERFLKITAESAEYRRDLANFLVNSGRDPGRGLELAEFDFRQRKDVFGADTVAWARHKNGKTAEAVAAIETSLKVGTKDPSIVAHAGLIFLDAGDKAKARPLLQAAKEREALLTQSLRVEVREALDRIR